MGYCVTKMEWEYGEAYGHAYVPLDRADFMRQLHALHTHAAKIDRPFYLAIMFSNNTEMGIVLGADRSPFYFGGDVGATSDTPGKPIATAYSDGTDWRETDDSDWLEYSYWGSLSNMPPGQVLPLATVLEVVMYYADHFKLLRTIPLYSTEIMEQYGEHSL